MPLVELTIDGARVEVPEGTTVLDAALAAGREIPRLCHLPGLPHRAVCRLCLVRVDGIPKPVASCHHPAAPDMVVHTASDELVGLRRSVMSYVLEEHGRCGRSSCEVEELAVRMGVPLPGCAPWLPESSPMSSAFIDIRPDACIHCDRCVRACGERQVITRTGRGWDIGIGFGAGASLAESACSGCGDCIAACPAGVLRPRRTGPPEVIGRLRTTIASLLTPAKATTDGSEEVEIVPPGR